MDDLDRRIAVGLRKLVDRAPVDAEVWSDTSRFVRQHRRRRHAVAGSSVAVLVLAVLAAIASQVTWSPNHVTVSGPKSPSSPRVGDPCSANCIGRASADVDGDGRIDGIGYFAGRPIDFAGAPQPVVIRVAFATGRSAEYHDTYTGLPALIGAADVNGDGRAEIFYLNSLGAHTQKGHILRWDGRRLQRVSTADGKPFVVVTDSYTGGSTGFRCVDDEFITVTLNPTDASNAVGGTWSGRRTTYAWNADQLVEVDRRSIDEPGPSAAKEYGADCVGLPQDTAALLPRLPGTTPPPSLAPAAPAVSAARLAPFVGTWAGHVGVVTVERDGTGSATWRTYRWCSDTHAQPCDELGPTGAITDGGHATFRVAHADGSFARTIVLSSTDPATVPTGPTELRVTSGDRIEFGRLLACGPRAAAGACGA